MKNIKTKYLLSCLTVFILSFIIFFIGIKITGGNPIFALMMPTSSYSWKEMVPEIPILLIGSALMTVLYIYVLKNKKSTTDNSSKPDTKDMKKNKYIHYIITYSLSFVFVFFLTKITGVVGRPELPINFTPFSWKEMFSEIPYVAFMSLLPLIAYIYVKRKRNINKDGKIN